MFSFYGDVLRAVPCVICDPGMHVLFANSTAYNEPVTMEWINGKARFLTGELTKRLEAAFEKDPHAIAKLDLHSKNRSCALLADRHTVCGATVYVFALVSASDSGDGRLPTENEGRRMLNAGFFPHYNDKNAAIPLNAELVSRWKEIAVSAAERAGKKLTVGSEISPAGCPIAKSGDLLRCAAAVLAAYCRNARRDISAFFKEDRYGASVTFSAELPIPSGHSLTACRNASLISACFASAAMPMLVAIQTAENCGFSLSADTADGDILTVTLRADTADIGELGFKVLTDLIGNTVSEIYAAAEMLI